MDSRHFITALVVAAVACAVPSVSLAYNETGTVDPNNPAASACPACHGSDATSMSAGPHGGYTSGSAKCQICHTVHAAPAGGAALLPKATVVGTCNFCHDGSGGRGVYGVLKARGLTVASSHSIDATNVVPGGNGATGGDAAMSFTGENGRLSCDDCHTPHASSAVAAFTGDRKRTATDTTFYSNRLLKKRPGGVGFDIARYGSDWCGACHQGRLYGTGVHNHPVETSQTGASEYYYDNAAILSTDAVTSIATTGSLGRTNNGYIMLYPRNAAPYAGHAGPICQQCHEDARNVGTLSSSGTTADAAAFVTASADGTLSTDNPRTQVFPHESTVASMLVEPDDDLCLNCHPVDRLP
jgi:hypothetical protein